MTRPDIGRPNKSVVANFLILRLSGWVSISLKVIIGLVLCGFASRVRSDLRDFGIAGGALLVETLGEGRSPRVRAYPFQWQGSSELRRPGC